VIKPVSPREVVEQFLAEAREIGKEHYELTLRIGGASRPAAGTTPWTRSGASRLATSGEHETLRLGAQAPGFFFWEDAMRTVDTLARVLAGYPARPFRGVVYRWVNPAFPLPPTGPGPGNCPTAGAYLVGARFNAKGAQAPLYTALEPEIAALEVVRYTPDPGEDLDAGGRAAARFLVGEGFQLFAIELALERVLDLGRHQDLARRFLEANWRGRSVTCQGPHPGARRPGCSICSAPAFSRRRAGGGSSSPAHLFSPFRGSRLPITFWDCRQKGGAEFLWRWS